LSRVLDVLRDLVKRALGAAGRMGAGKNLVHAAVLADPGRARYASVERWPEQIEGFEDLAFLFSSNQLSHGIASLQLDEAALLYGLARRVPAGAAVAEIGRFKGGSTVITAAAMDAGAELWSYDLSSENDRELLDALRRLGLDARVHLVVGDSRSVELPPAPLRSLFVDGDHSYEGARADYLRWRGLVAPGGNLLFHDAVDTGGYGNHYPGIARLVAEIERDDGDFERRPDAGSVAHFVRRA
jgi:predicted O-methyltransferase YrrM